MTYRMMLDADSSIRDDPECQSAAKGTSANPRDATHRASRGATILARLDPETSDGKRSNCGAS